jgi:hypothetical protein
VEHILESSGLRKIDVLEWKVRYDVSQKLELPTATANSSMPVASVSRSAKTVASL